MTDQEWLAQFKVGTRVRCVEDGVTITGEVEGHLLSEHMTGLWVWIEGIPHMVWKLR